MKKLVITAAAVLLSCNAMAEENLITPADISEEAQNKMYQLVSDYNLCMMQGRLQVDPTGKSPQDYAQAIMDTCENNLDTLQVHLTENSVSQPLVEGMIMKMRSRGARQLMTRTMNKMAAQAAAMQAAEETEQAAE